MATVFGDDGNAFGFFRFHHLVIIQYRIVGIASIRRILFHDVIPISHTVFFLHISRQGGVILVVVARLTDAYLHPVSVRLLGIGNGNDRHAGKGFRVLSHVETYILRLAPFRRREGEPFRFAGGNPAAALTLHIERVIVRRTLDAPGIFGHGYADGSRNQFFGQVDKSVVIIAARGCGDGKAQQQGERKE